MTATSPGLWVSGGLEAVAGTWSLLRVLGGCWALTPGVCWTMLGLATLTNCSNSAFPFLIPTSCCC